MRKIIKFADIVLYHKPSMPDVVIEAKENKHTIGDGMQQALAYADTLDTPFVFLVMVMASYSMIRLVCRIRWSKNLRLNNFPTQSSCGNVISNGKMSKVLVLR